MKQIIRLKKEYAIIFNPSYISSLWGAEREN